MSLQSILAFQNRLRQIVLLYSITESPEPIEQAELSYLFELKPK